MAQEPRQGTGTRIGDTPAELERYMNDQLYEYSKWRATQDIYAGTALAFPKGYPVPTSTVEAQGYDKNGLVELVNPPAEEKPVVRGPSPKVDK